MTHIHNDAQKTSALYDLSSYGLIHISGDDAKKFLQGQLTVNLEDMTQDNYKLSAFCNPKGRIISLFTLLLSPFSDYSDYFLILPKSLIAPTLLSLKKYALFYKVSLNDISEDFTLAGINITHSLFALELQSTLLPDFSQYSLGSHVYLKWPIPDLALGLFPKSENNQVLNTQKDCLLKYEAWHMAEIQHGIPRLYPDTMEHFLPHDINLPHLQAVSFNKGCFTGQEIIARMHYKGQLKSHLYYLSATASKTSEIPSPKTKILHKDKKVGEIVSSVLFDNQYHLLAVAQSSIESAINIRCDQENAPILDIRKSFYVKS